MFAVLLTLWLVSRRPIRAESWRERVRGCPTTESVLAEWIRRVVRYGTLLAAVAAITGSAVAATPFTPPAPVTPTLPPAASSPTKLADGQLRETVDDLQAGRTPPAGAKVVG